MPDWIFRDTPIRFRTMTELIKEVGKMNGMRMRVILRERVVVEMKYKDDFDDDFQEGMA